MVRICILTLAGALALSAVPAVAAAKPCGGGTEQVPGDSEIDQYAQSIPGACGNQEQGDDQVGGGGSAGGGEGGSPTGAAISPSTRERLADLGAAGTAAETLADQNAPRIRQNGDGGAGGSRGGSGGGESQAGGVIDSLLGDADGGGMGIILPLILLAIAAGGALYVANRRARQAG